MDYKKVKEEVSKLSGDELITMCNEIYEWKYNTGELNKDATLREFAKRINCNNIRDIEEEIIGFCSHKLQKTVLLLFESQPYDFLKRIK